MNNSRLDNVISVVGTIKSTPEKMISKKDKTWTKFTIKFDHSQIQVGVIEVCCFDEKNVENVLQYCKEGMIVRVTGRLKVGSFTSKDNQVTYTMTIYPSQIEYVGKSEDFVSEHLDIEFVNFNKHNQKADSSDKISDDKNLGD